MLREENIGVFVIKIKEIFMKKDIIKIIESLENLCEPHPANIEQVEEAQRILGVKFADDYTQLLLKHGPLVAKGIELLGIADPKFEYINVVPNTLREYEYDKTAPKNMYVIEDIGIDGLLIWQDQTGAVYGKMRFDTELEKLSNSLAEYIIEATGNNDLDY